ncbi:cupin domain-containing protein [Lipingzhangella sp. LS1_29]|uniref:Cupin domain-containing protein n=1 Tax=Lipingzhangella rawalii TaxID=2055835 RepID=A0ABU2H867_9ACTN|nr:cupin domain-containing protein [Lipingzhangella rawalii]MDS1271050.1 cupin domain-containing protein [Lipingzhangella rawalii]
MVEELPDTSSSYPKIVTFSTLASGTTTHQDRIEVDDDMSLIFAKIQIPPGESTGWHYHQGPVLIVVQSGKLKHTMKSGETQHITEGSAFIEPFGEEASHIGYNEMRTPLILYAAYLLPAGAPLAIATDGPESVG